GEDLYSVLLSEINKRGLWERIMFGSLNYECLLEQSLSRISIVTDYMLGDFSVGVPVAKIHGSANFVTEDVFTWRAHLSNRNASSIECSFAAVPIEGLHGRLTTHFGSYQPAFFPVLSVYSPEKPSMVGPARLQRLRNTL